MIDLNGSVLALDAVATCWLDDYLRNDNSLDGSLKRELFIRDSIGYHYFYRRDWVSALAHNINSVACRGLLYLSVIASLALPGIRLRHSILAAGVCVAIHTLGFFEACSAAQVVRPKLRRLAFRFLADDSLHSYSRYVEAFFSRSWLPVACKERALVFYLIAGAIEPSLEIVVGFQWAPVAGHAWCELHEEIFTDSDTARVRSFEPVSRMS